MARNTRKKPETLKPATAPDSIESAHPIHSALAWALAAAGGASLLGGWRLWCVPVQPVIEAYPDVWGLGAFVTIGALAGLAVAAIWWVSAGATGVQARTRALVWGALPLLASWLPVGGSDGRVWTALWLIFVAGAAGALAAYSIRNEDLHEISPKAAGISVGVMIAMFVTGYGSATILGLHSFHNGSYTDFGGFVNSAWNTLHGRLMWSDHWNGSIWGEHITLYDLLPMLTLWVWPRAEGYLIWQTAVTALAAVPIYMMARRDTESRAFALALAFAWIFNPFNGRNVMFEYHSLYFAALAMAWLLWACHPKTPTWLFLTLGAAALVVREDMPLAIIGVGMWEAAVGRRWKRGTALMLMSVVWAVLALKFLMPSAAAGHWTWPAAASGHIDRYSHLGGSYGGIVTHIRTEPLKTLSLLFVPTEAGQSPQAKLANHLLLVLPLGLLPLLGWRRVWVAIPIFLLHGISNWHFQNEFDCHYTSPLMPILFFAAVDGARQLSRYLKKVPVRAEAAYRIAAWMLIGAALAGQLFGARWRPGIPPSFAPYDGRHHMTILALPWRAEMLNVPEHARLFQDLRRVLPREAGVAAPDPAVPMLAARATARAFRYIGSKPMEQLQYVLFHPYVPAYTTRDNVLKLLDQMMRDPDWRVIWVRQGWIVFGRNAPGADPIAPKLAQIEGRRKDTVDGHLIVSQLAMQAGNTELARNEAVKVMMLDPGNEWAKQVLGR